MMRIVIAPDKFKGSLGANEVAAASVLLERVGRTIVRDQLAGLLRTDTTDAPAGRRLRANTTGERQADGSAGRNHEPGK
jgi:hypothetical protein